MADGSIDIAYSTHSFSFTKFNSTELPQQRVEQASLNYSALGVGYMTGPAISQKKMWAIDAIIESSERDTLEALYAAWDARRATGANDAIVTLVDGLLSSSSTSYNCAITSPPSYSTKGKGRTRYLNVSMALMEL
jgi:hypothetical protein